jgi:phage gp45-like
MICLPEPGDQVLVVPQEGDIEQGIIIGACYSRVQRPPAAQSGEFWLVHKSGSFIKLGNDGIVHVGGDLRVSGDVYDKEGSLSHLRNTYNTHTHPTADGTSGKPSPLDTANV